MSTNYSIRLEDEELESFAMSDDGEIALPAEVYAPSVGEAVITCYREVSSTVRELLDAGADPLTKSGSAAFDASLGRIMASHGFLQPSEEREVIFEYEMTSPATSGITSAAIMTGDEASCLPAEVSEQSLTSDILCSVTRNGKIVAAAGINDITYDGDPEIYVECAPAYRGFGFGSTAAAGLASHLLTAGGQSRIIYCCKERNTASVKCALRAGFTLCARRLPFVFYR